MRTPAVVSRWSGVPTRTTCPGRCFLAVLQLRHSLQIAAPAPDQAESFPRDTSPHSCQSHLHMSACAEPSAERLVRVDIPPCLCRWNVCVCVRARPSVRCSVFVSGGCRAPPPLPPLLSPSPHAAAETQPEIFNSVAAVNRAATLEAMSHS